MPLKIKLFVANLILLIFPGAVIFFLAKSWIAAHVLNANLSLAIFIGIGALLFVVNAILSLLIADSIVTPLKKLSVGARHIQEGNLDFKMTYETKDEFYHVIKEFDQMRLRLKETLDQNIKYQEERKNFIASITHDLKTPITSIQGYIEAMLDGIASTPEKQQKYLETALRKTKDVNKLVDDLFIITKLDLSNASLLLEPVDVNSFIEAILKDMALEFAEKNITIEVYFANGLTALIDAAQTRRVIQNIIQNSMKYKSVEDLNIKITTKENEKNIIIIIEDNGIGIASDNESLIFESFYREDATRRHGEGSGLGLAISKKAIEAQGGRIWARSRQHGLAIYISIIKFMGD